MHPLCGILQNKYDLRFAIFLVVSSAVL